MDSRVRFSSIGPSKISTLNASSALGDPKMDINPARRGCWAWLILLSAFICTAVVDGLMLSFGLHILEMMMTPSFSSWVGNGHSIPFFNYLLPGALLTGMHLYASPLANVLSNQFDYRPVAMASAFLSGIVFMSSAFIENIEAFSLFVGVCGGLSCGLLYFPSLSVVAQWFESRRALAVGLAICGSGVGTCLIAVFFSSAVQTFSWRGLLIIFGAVFFQLAVAVALFRPVEIQQIIILEKLKRRSKERLRRLERERLAAVVHREKSGQTATDQSQNQRRGITPRVGGIMSRILEEKLHQRSSSTGSLDDVVITRDNKLVSLRTGVECDSFRTAAISADGRIDQLSSALIQSPIGRFSVSDRSINPLPASANRSKFPNPRPVLLLSPPREFSKSGVIRIADAILQKLEVRVMVSPGLRCPDMTSFFRRWSSTLQSTFTLENSSDLSSFEPGSRSQQQIPDVCSENRTVNAVLGSKSGDRLNVMKATAITNSIAPRTCTGNSVHTPWSVVDSTAVPIMCGSDDSGKTVSVDALDVNSFLRVTPQFRPISHFSSCRCSSSIDLKTDRAIDSELSRVHLDSSVKAHIRAAIYHKLKPNGQMNSKPRDYHRHISNAGTNDFTQQFSYSGLEQRTVELKTDQTTVIGEGLNRHPSCDHDMSTRLSKTFFSRCGATGEIPDNKSSLLTSLIDALDLQLLLSPSFLTLSLACTLHMFAFFAPYHLLPIFVSLEGRTLSCGRLMWSNYFGTDFRVSERLASPISLTFTIGIAHLVGRLIATFYIERIVSEPTFLQHYESEDVTEGETWLRLLQRVRRTILNKLSDPMILNIVSLVTGGVCLLCIPLTSLQIRSSQHAPSCSSLVPLRGILFVLVFLHTLCSALAISLRSVIAVELIGVHHLTAAFVYLLVFQGTGGIAGPILIGLIAEAISGVQISARFLSDPQYLSAGMGANPLSYVYYACGLVFLLSALAYAPLRTLSGWETRRYFSKRSFGTHPSVPSPHSAMTDAPNDVSIQQIKRNSSVSPVEASVTSMGDNQVHVSPVGQKAPSYNRQPMTSPCSPLSELNHVSFLMPNAL